ncbi:MAG: ComEC family competence protein [Bacteroidales bacterium]|nr:ComEC family competence protein [Bacteroidales bacterium]MCF8454644.1 ComEC family competence protein [Bacteroidales bacterium]
MASNLNIRQNPLLRILFPFMSGIVFAYHCHVTSQAIFPTLVFILFSITLLIFIGKFFGSFQYHWVSGMLIFACWLAIGFVLTAMQANYSFPDKISEECLTYTGTISEEPTSGKNSLKVIVDLQAVLEAGKLNPVVEKVMLYLPPGPAADAMKYGDKLFFNASLQAVKSRGNPGEFDYATFLKREGIYRTAFVGNGKFLQEGGFGGNRLIRFALQCRRKLLYSYREYGLSGQELAIVSALTIGYKEDLSEPTRKAFSDSGAMHILAVSGLHVGIIQLILNLLLVFLDRNKKAKIAKAFIIILALWFYALITGLSPSVTRAAMMFSLIQIGISFQKDIIIFNIVAATALVVLLFYPLLLFDIGFQFSYLALSGILFFYPKIYPLVRSKVWIIDKTWALMVASFSAQLSLAPLSIFYFGQFPNYFLLTNLVAIPSAFFIIVVAVALFAFSFVDFLASAFGFILQKGVGFLIKGLVFIQDLPGSVSTGVHLNQASLILWYLVIGAISIYLIRINKKALIAALGLVAIILSLGLTDQYKSNKSARFTVFNLSKSTAIYARSGDRSIMLCDSALSHSEESRSFYVDRFVNSEGARKTSFINLDSLSEDNIGSTELYYRPGFLAFDSLKMAIVSDNFYKNKRSPDKLDVDYVLLRNNPSIGIQKLRDIFDFDELIIDGSNPMWKIEKWQQECDTLGIRYFITNQNGAKDLTFKF